MTTQKHQIKVSKTASYFTQGQLNEHTKYIWLVIHGFAQTADTFIQPFSILGEEHFVIAPEGLNRFYSRGFAGSAVANWMTSRDREFEIEDYCNYLNLLTKQLNITQYKNAKVILLGFSQGVSTLTRFFLSGNIHADLLVMVAGEIAIEFQKDLPTKLVQAKSLYLVGTQENLIKPEKIEFQKQLLANCKCSIMEFEGKHEVNEAAVLVVQTYLLENQ